MNKLTGSRSMLVLAGDSKGSTVSESAVWKNKWL